MIHKVMSDCIHCLTIPILILCVFFLLECCPLYDPPNGNVSYTGLVFGSIATYHCAEGYQLKGTNQRFCGSDGMWNGSMPVCEKGKVNFYMM